MPRFGHVYQVIIALALIALAFLVSQRGPAGAAGPIATVSIQDFRFEAKDLTIVAGTTVTWSHSGVALHTVTSDSGIWDSGFLTGGQSFSHTFSIPGTFPYHCIPHRSIGMTGTITVLPATTVQGFLPFLARNSSGP